MALGNDYGLAACFADAVQCGVGELGNQPGDAPASPVSEDLQYGGAHHPEATMMERLVWLTWQTWQAQLTQV